MAKRDAQRVERSDAKAGAHRNGRSAESFSRRSFLTSSAVAVAAGTLTRTWAGTKGGVTASKKKVVVGGHLWVYAATQPGYDPFPVLETVFADLSYAGIEAVELMERALRHDDAVERIGELSQKYKLPVLGTSFEGDMWNRAAHTAILEDAERVVARLAKLGGRTFGTSVGKSPNPKTPEQLDAQAEMLRKITALCAGHGIVLNLHNHTYEVENNEHDLKGTLARVPDAKLGPDLNWLLRAGVDPVDFIKRYGARIIFLHLRDQRADGKWSEALGEGNMDYAAIGRELQKVNFSGDAVIELAHERDFKLTRPLGESWKMSRDFVRKTLGY
jgi:sugar phosphate isomerase/epimerase